MSETVVYTHVKLPDCEYCHKAKDLLEKHFVLERHYGTFTQSHNFNKNHRANMRWSQNVIDDIKNRFDKHWQRVILATAYPETANNVNWHLRKK